MSVSEFTMIRHGQTVDNIKGRLQGHHDSPLDATGLAQANQNHRLSRWYAPRLQGVCTGSPIRALNDSPIATILQASAKAVFFMPYYSCYP